MVERQDVEALEDLAEVEGREFSSYVRGILRGHVRRASRQ
jgi:hypothetical protein